MAFYHIHLIESTGFLEVLLRQIKAFQLLVRPQIRLLYQIKLGQETRDLYEVSGKMSAYDSRLLL
jgi:hypothetical protein